MPCRLLLPLKQLMIPCKIGITSPLMILEKTMPDKKGNCKIHRKTKKNQKETMKAMKKTKECSNHQKEEGNIQ